MSVTLGWHYLGPIEKVDAAIGALLAITAKDSDRLPVTVKLPGGVECESPFHTRKASPILDAAHPLEGTLHIRTPLDKGLRNCAGDDELEVRRTKSGARIALVPLDVGLAVGREYFLVTFASDGNLSNALYNSPGLRERLLKVVQAGECVLTIQYADGLLSREGYEESIEMTPFYNSDGIDVDRYAEHFLGLE